MKNTLLLLLILLSLNGCDKATKDDELTMARQPYNGNELRLDGYYYEINPHTNGIGEALLLYRDGTMLLCGGSGENSDPFGYMDNLLASPDFIEHAKQHAFYWGVFQINDRAIRYERWYQGDGGLPVGRSEGNITNDPPFVINKITMLNTGNETAENIVFHFRHYTPKPDSTNQFIH